MDLQFEKPLLELRMKIEDLKKFMEEKDIDLSGEVEKLEQKAAEMEQMIYEDLLPYQRVLISRHPNRPKTLDYIKAVAENFIELHGDRSFRDDPAIVGGIGLLDGIPVTLIGHQKGRDTKENIYRNFGQPYPEGFRKSLRLMKQAEKFGRPIVCFVDTPGAFPGMEAEERGQSEAIAANLLAMAGLRVPILCVVTGEGGSGGGLALGMGDRVFMLEHAYYSVISPEGAAAILLRDSAQSSRAAELLKITSENLLRFGVIDGIVPEPAGGAHKDPQSVIQRVKQLLVEQLRELKAISVDDLLALRYEKYKSIGEFTSVLLDGETDGLQA